MPTRKQVLKEMEHWFSAIQSAQTELGRLRPEAFVDENTYDERQRELNDQIRSYSLKMEKVLEELDRIPERHAGRHSPRLKEFWKTGGYDKSVFIMTKFPKNGEPAASELEKVLKILSEQVSARGFVPRIASNQQLHRWLWDNVEVYLLGCARGIAVVEDKYLPELNPNVAMEWGWMVGMGRDVLFLREHTFKHDRADWSGLLNNEFEWANPTPGIAAALDAYLGKAIAAGAGLGPAGGSS